MALSTLHRQAGSPFRGTFNSWVGMKQRCYDQNSKSYPNYGGRGITVSDEWLEYDNFFADMGKKPDGYSLDRIDNDGNYCKENCKWADQFEQKRNRRAYKPNEKGVMIRGHLFKQKQACQLIGISPPALQANMKQYNRSAQEAIDYLMSRTPEDRHFKPFNEALFEKLCLQQGSSEVTE